MMPLVPFPVRRERCGFCDGTGRAYQGAMGPAVDGRLIKVKTTCPYCLGEGWVRVWG